MGPVTIEIAVVGMSGRFPGADDLDQFWSNLSDGVESIRVLSEQELDEAGVNRETRGQPNYVPVGSVLDGIDLFDAGFFGISPREAESMDPQQRLLLEEAWHALEDAGYDPDRYPGKIGVYAGCAMSSYYQHLMRCPEFVGLVGYIQVLIGNDKDYLSSHVSYKLNLRGPSVGIQTTCSTSLTAIHYACEGLLAGECDMALAGGVCVRVPQYSGYFYTPGGIFSPDGHCRVFDADAQGVVFGSGVGLVVLRRLADALADGDNVRAVIKASRLNNDGSAKASYAAPGLEGQVDVITQAHAKAGVHPETISFVETHGTGTQIGDPIELAALTQAFRGRTSRKGFCAVGSVKTNIGHLDHAAGVAGFIKTVLALENKAIPPSLHFVKPHPEIDFKNSPFFVNTTLAPWASPRLSLPRRAAISAFGIGGTNVHVILQEAPPSRRRRRSRSLQLLTLSGRTSTALDALSERLGERLLTPPQLHLPDIAYTGHVGRQALPHRRFIVCRDTASAAAALIGNGGDGEAVAVSGIAPAKARTVAFMFTGQGSQYVSMGAGLYRTESAFRRAVDQCAEILAAHTDKDLRRLLYPASGQRKSAAEQLRRTANTQPALFVIEYAMAQLLIEWGLRPVAMIGHSIGEYVAACLSGTLSLEAALRVVAERGRLMQALPAGAMMAVPFAEDKTLAILRKNAAECPTLSIATINDATQCVVAGPFQEMERLEKILTRMGVEGRRLQTSHAFHSAMMDPILPEFTRLMRRTSLQPPQVPWVSNVTGTWITPRQATDPKYWAKHLRQPVRFLSGLTSLLEDQHRLLIEIGPGQTLTTFARHHPGKLKSHTVLPTIRRAQESSTDSEFAVRALGYAWLSGADVDWNGFHRDERPRRVSLPTYPFERERYWVDPPNQTPRRGARRKANPADWFYLPVWKPTPPPADADSSDQRWLVFMDDVGVGRELVDLLHRRNIEVVRVAAGAAFAAQGDVIRMNPASKPDYFALVSELGRNGKLPGRIAYLSCLSLRTDDLSGSGSAAERFGNDGASAWERLLFLSQALAEFRATDELRIGVATNQLFSISGDEQLSPAQATIIGVARVVPQEYLHLRFRHIDLALPDAPTDTSLQALASHVATELSAENGAVTSAYRGGQRYIESFKPRRLRVPTKLPPLRRRGVYLITGGMGGIGLELAQDLCTRAQARVVLVGRSGFPAPSTWSSWLQSHSPDDATSARIRKIQQMEAVGGAVRIAKCDVSDARLVGDLARAIRKGWGRLDGVIHAAGTVAPEAFGNLDQASPGLLELHMRPKVVGLLVLEQAVRETFEPGRRPGFWLLASSLSTVLGGLGYIGYVAANACLDAIAASRNSKRRVSSRRGSGGPMWVSVNWDGWQAAGAPAAATPDPLLSAADGVETFRRILGHASPGRIVVSLSDLRARIRKWVVFGGSDVADSHMHQRPALSVPYTAPRNSVEATIAEIWREVLGIDKIGIHDNFFDLGGQSLAAAQLVARIRAAFKCDLPLRKFIERPTVAGLTGSLNGAIPSHSVTAPAPPADNPEKLRLLSNPDAKPLLHRAATGFATNRAGVRN